MRHLVLFVLALIMWCMLVWPYDAETGLDVQNIILGAVAALCVAALFGRLFTESPHKFFDPRRYLWLIIYLPVFAYYCLKANLEVVYLVLHPQMPIEPGIVKVKTRLEGSSAITALANSITLTPGTLTVDTTGQGDMYIHWLKVETTDEAEASKRIVGKFEPFLEGIFG